MAILNYTTSIDYDKTISEISAILRNHGANRITHDYRDKLPIAVMFSIEVHGQTIAFSLPCNYTGVLKSMERDKKVPRNKVNEEQALRVGWRIVKDWVEAQCALVECELASMAEVFLPYAVTPTGETLYKSLESKGFGKLLLTQS